MHEVALLIAIIIVVILLFCYDPQKEEYNSLKAPLIYLYPKSPYRGNPMEFRRGQRVRIGFLNMKGLYQPIWNSAHLSIKNSANLVFYAGQRKCLHIRVTSNIPDLYSVLRAGNCAIAAGDSIFLDYESGS